MTSPAVEKELAEKTEKLGPTDLVKASFHLSRADMDALKELADLRQTSVTQALREAIATQRFLVNLPEGSRLLVETPDHRGLREVVLPFRRD